MPGAGSKRGVDAKIALHSFPVQPALLRCANGAHARTQVTAMRQGGKKWDGIKGRREHSTELVKYKIAVSRDSPP
jgi:hypothetical protein